MITNADDCKQDGICKEHSGLIADIQTLKDSNVKQWEAIDRINDKIEKYANRMPNWAALMFAGISAIASAATTYAVFVK